LLLLLLCRLPILLLPRLRQILVPAVFAVFQLLNTRFSPTARPNRSESGFPRAADGASLTH
jgi:hypothetical protein